MGRLCGNGSGSEVMTLNRVLSCANVTTKGSSMTNLFHYLKNQHPVPFAENNVQQDRPLLLQVKAVHVSESKGTLTTSFSSVVPYHKNKVARNNSYSGIQFAKAAQSPSAQHRRGSSRGYFKLLKILCEAKTLPILYNKVPDGLSRK